MNPVNMNQKSTQMKRYSEIYPRVLYDFGMIKHRLIKIVFKYLQDTANYLNFHYLNLPVNHQSEPVVTIQTIA